jgi:hypothetical protein
MEIAAGYHYLMTTTLPTSTFHLQGSKLLLGCLPVRSEVSVTAGGGDRAKDPLVRDATWESNSGSLKSDIAAPHNYKM